MVWMDIIPFFGIGTIALIGALFYMRHMQKTTQKNLVTLDEDLPKERQPFVFYAGKGGEGYYGKIVWRHSYQNTHHIKIANENRGGAVELNLIFKENINVLPYSDLLGGRVTLACNVDALNIVHEWDTTRLEQLKQGFSEITTERIKHEERQSFKNDVELAGQLQPTRGRQPLPSLPSDDINERFR